MINAMVDGRWSRSMVYGRSWSSAACLSLALDAQTRRPTTRKPAPAARKPTVAPAEMTCPSPLGTGVKTKREYCDVLTGRDPKEGILIKLPPHRGPVTLRFNLHNRHTYSEEEVRMKRGVRVVHRRHRRVDARQHAADARGGRERSSAAPRICSSASAAAPAPAASKRSRRSASKPITLELAAELTEVVDPRREADGRSRRRPARELCGARPPIAIISDVTVEYTPAPGSARGVAD